MWIIASRESSQRSSWITITCTNCFTRPSSTDDMTKEPFRKHCSYQCCFYSNFRYFIQLLAITANKDIVFKSYFSIKTREMIKSIWFYNNLWLYIEIWAVFKVSEGKVANSLALPHPETEAAVPAKWSTSRVGASGRQTGLIVSSNSTADSRIKMATS